MGCRSALQCTDGRQWGDFKHPPFKMSFTSSKYCWSSDNPCPTKCVNSGETYRWVGIARTSYAIHRTSWKGYSANFVLTAFSEVAGYQCDSTAAWRSVGALLLRLPSVGVLAAELDSLPYSGEHKD